MSRENGQIKRGSARERILQTAGDLFYRYGFRAVGVDTVIAASGVAKMTLYKHFPSKDALVVAYLERSNEAFWGWYEEVVRPFEGDPRRQLGAVFEGVSARASSPQCLGCTFTGAAGEFPDPGHPGHRAALGHKKQVLSKFESLAEAAGLREPRALAEALLLLMDGAWNAARMFGPGSHAKSVADAANIMIEAYTQAPLTPSRREPLRKASRS